MKLKLAIFFVVFCYGYQSSAGPWLAPEPAIRADLETLAAAGMIKTPLMTWPVSVGSLKADLARYSISRVPVALLGPFNRVRRRLDRESEAGLHSQSRVEWSSEQRSNQGLLSFPDETRLAAGPSYLNDWFAGRLSVNRRIEPRTQRSTEWDDSYLAASLGNWTLGAGKQRQFWGPQWQHSWALDTLAVPMESLWVTRNQAQDDAWGPWGMQWMLSRSEPDEQERKATFYSLRTDWRPTSGLEWAANWRVQRLTHEDDAISTSNSGQDSSQWGTDFRWQYSRASALYGQWQQFDDPGQRLQPWTLGWSFRPQSQSSDRLWSWYGEWQQQPRALETESVWFRSGVPRNQGLQVEAFQQLTLGTQLNLVNRGDWHGRIQYQWDMASEEEAVPWQVGVQRGLPCFGFSCLFSLDWRSAAAEPWSFGITWNSNPY